MHCSTPIAKKTIARRAFRAALALTLATTLALPATALAAPGESGETPAASTEDTMASSQDTPASAPQTNPTEEAAPQPQPPTQEKPTNDPAGPTLDARPESLPSPDMPSQQPAATAVPTPQAAESAKPATDPTPRAPVTNGPTRIHVLAFAGISCDAILLESNGHFGMVDAGEDTDRPNGSDPRYPANRPFISEADQGVEKEVIAYLKSVGVTENNFDFFIGTHPHSDHIGGADTVISTFKPKRVYTPEYKDEYIKPYVDENGVTASWEKHPYLWDNLYVYDQLLAASAGVGAELIQSLNPSSAVFSLGNDMRVEIVNYDEGYKTIPTTDANDFCWGVKVTAHGKSAFLSGDINNYQGDEDALAKTLGHIDVLKLGHHGASGSNSIPYLKAILATSASSTAPVVLQTGPFSHCPPELISTLESLRATHYLTFEAAAGGKGAIVVTFGKNGISTNVAGSPATLRQRWTSPFLTNYVDGRQKPLSGWVSHNGNWYWFENSPRATESQWLNRGGSWYYLTENAAMAVGWAHDGNAWYYLNGSGVMQTGWLNNGGTWYYLAPSGAMVTGWLNDGGTWYYLTASGAMATSWYQVDGTWYFSNASGAMQTGWLNIGGVWYWLDASGAMAENAWRNIHGTWYYLGAGGAMRTGWFQVGGTWYLANGSGAMLTGWQRVGGAWYYLHGSGAMAEGWVNLGGTWYYLYPGSGAMHVGWLQLGGTWYYLNGSGAMVTGRQVIDGRPYTFAPSGAMVG